MYLVYLDDSRVESRFQALGAVVIVDTAFTHIENVLGLLIETYVSEEDRRSFEFHASAMFHRKHPFEELTPDACLTLFHECTLLIENLKIPIIYGAVDLAALKQELWSTANVVDMAFQQCARGIENWFKVNAPHNLGILIADMESGKDKNPARGDMVQAFRRMRKPLKGSVQDRGELEHVHDDMYFGASAYSVGIQLADICTFIVMRHLEGKQDTEYLYKIIEPFVIGDMVPKV